MNLPAVEHSELPSLAKTAYAAFRRNGNMVKPNAVAALAILPVAITLWLSLLLGTLAPLIVGAVGLSGLGIVFLTNWFSWLRRLKNFEPSRQEEERLLYYYRLHPESFPVEALKSTNAALRAAAEDLFKELEPVQRSMFYTEASAQENARRLLDLGFDGTFPELRKIVANPLSASLSIATLLFERDLNEKAQAAKTLNCSDSAEHLRRLRVRFEEAAEETIFLIRNTPELDLGDLQLKLEDLGAAAEACFTKIEKESRIKKVRERTRQKISVELERLTGELAEINESITEQKVLLAKENALNLVTAEVQSLAEGFASVKAYRSVISH